ncbi:T9SS type A sorting domain-containing protein [Flavobacterium macrobrachii]|uniref:T9SS type A sorting domain-containing protein n=1 Tax=Flavobacterium macrobrachii TaxID=591204 RepID=A0ABS2CTQ8_9FLAO|nr:T9SS type A sorting domain-containing protein [Flavobacterium macrobrachii]MBM6498301.1 T9SS type A sorting domain-containing protein [Flavobacterium macrobrachii]
MEKNVSNLILSVTLLLLSITQLQSQTKRVLFIGNSYTSVNNLPQTIASVASSVGDNLIFDSNTPGGYRFMDHATNPTTLQKIGIGNWDYVVLQEQSQYPSFPDWQVEQDVYPYAQSLNNAILNANQCTETIFYMTWGRKNGDAQNCPNLPEVCTYLGMDNLLNARYRTMAQDNNAILSPVGAVWRYIRQNFPTIELYQADESHPSVAGTYAAACAFYTVIYRKDPTLITFNSTLSASVAQNIKNATKLVVYNNLAEWHVGTYDPVAQFNFTVSGEQVYFNNTSLMASAYNWDFGDGSSSFEINPSHTYSSTGIFTVKLKATNCGIENNYIQNITISQLNTEIPANNDANLLIYPNPTNATLNIQLGNDLTINSLKIYDIFGKLIIEESQNFNQINVENFNTGVYIIEVVSDEKIYKNKFVKI